MRGSAGIGLLADLAQAHGPQFLVAELARQLVGQRARQAVVLQDHRVQQRIERRLGLRGGLGLVAQRRPYRRRRIAARRLPGWMLIATSRSLPSTPGACRRSVTRSAPDSGDTAPGRIWGSPRRRCQGQNAAWLHCGAGPAPIPRPSLARSPYTEAQFDPCTFLTRRPGSASRADRPGLARDPGASWPAPVVRPRQHPRRPATAAARNWRPAAPGGPGAGPRQAVPRGGSSSLRGEAKAAARRPL